MAEAGGSRRMAETDGGSRALPGGQLTGRLGVHLGVHLIKRGGPRGYSVKRRGRRVWDDEGGGPGTSGPGTARVVGPGGLGCQTRTGMVLVSLGAGGWGRGVIVGILGPWLLYPPPPPRTIRGSFGRFSTLWNAGAHTRAHKDSKGVDEPTGPHKGDLSSRMFSSRRTKDVRHIAVQAGAVSGL